jgi:hypothetical protein
MPVILAHKLRQEDCELEVSLELHSEMSQNNNSTSKQKQVALRKDSEKNDF